MYQGCWNLPSGGGQEQKGGGGGRIPLLYSPYIPGHTIMQRGDFPSPPSKIGGRGARSTILKSWSSNKENRVRRRGKFPYMHN